MERIASTISTEAELARATTMRLFPKKARVTAVARAAIPLNTEPVLLRIAGNVMAVRQA